MKTNIQMNISFVFNVSGKGVAPFPTPRCSSYRKGSLRVTLNYGHQLYSSNVYNSFFLDVLVV